VRTTVQTPSGPKDVPDYAFIQGIFIGVVSAYIIVLALIGPENHGSHFEKGKTAFQAGASKEDVVSVPIGAEEIEVSSMGSAGGQEKDVVQHVEDKRPARDSFV
jgi:SHS family lactate transporter-like MFS transporter